jgi:hypothetical protein
MEFGQPGQYGQYMSDDYVKTQWGWNVRYCRPATKDETFQKSWETCMCCGCSSDGHYSEFYCGRMKASGYLANLERFYWRNRGQ